MQRRDAALLTLALFYTAQGIPFGFAAEYLPVVLREAHYSRTAIAAVFWLQLPWQLKLFGAGRGPPRGASARAVRALALQSSALAGAVVLYVPFDLARAAGAWFAITALCAFIVTVEDIFADVIAVRSLAPRDRGFGNVAQVAGHRLGILLGAGLLLAANRWQPPQRILACAALIALASVGAFAPRGDDRPTMPRARRRALSLRRSHRRGRATRARARARPTALRHAPRTRGPRRLWGSRARGAT